jgi:uncharacterized repeat protein (TIGR03803 family)
MPKKRNIVVSIIAVVACLQGAALAVANEQVLHSFCVKDSSCARGAIPWDGLVFDSAGNLYGTTLEGGAHGLGVVFQLVPRANGGWTEKVLHSFSGPDGAAPQSGVIFDSAGNLYGTTFFGGKGRKACDGGCGTVFRLEPGKNGLWKETVLYSFCSVSNCADGGGAWSGLVLDMAGNLYGTANQGGTMNYGVVYKLHPESNGAWTEQVLHYFDSNGKDGRFPEAALILDSSGTLYGTTPVGGQYDSGIAFSLHIAKNGEWRETVLHSFGNGGADGRIPIAALLLASDGRLYGTTQSGGSFGYGNVFVLEQRGNRWTEQMLHSFNRKDGFLTHSNVISDAKGNLYGTSGGGTYGQGLVFELIPVSKSKWREKVLYSFRDNGKDGRGAETGLIFDSAGNLYGTTFEGGASGDGCDGYGCGAVFKVMP